MSETRIDELIDRITAGEADAEEFHAFAARAQREQQAWEQLARAQRDELAMRAALAAEDHAAHAEAEIARAVGEGRPGRSAAPAPGRTLRAWSGWAAAAVIALVWAIYQPGPSAPPSAPGSMATEQPAIETRLASYTADDAFERYLQLGHDEGRVIRELPARMIEIESADDGEIIVYYVRQLLERERVNEMYQYAEDELGRPVAVPVDFSSLMVTESSL